MISSPSWTGHRGERLENGSRTLSVLDGGKMVEEGGDGDGNMPREQK
jgi:hypothetical protein